MQIAYLLDFAIALAGGVLGGMLFAWSLARRAYRLEIEMADLQETVLRDKKKRSAQARWGAEDDLDGILKAAKPAEETLPDSMWPWAAKRGKESAK